MDKVRVLQKHDPVITDITDFRRKVAVPEDKTRAAWLSSMDPRFDVVRGILYYMDRSLYYVDRS